MRHSLTILFLLLIGTLLVKQVRAPVPHIDDPDTVSSDPPIVPNTNTDDNPGSSSSSGDGSVSGDGDPTGIDGILDGGTSSGGAPAVVPQGNEAEFEEEDTDYEEILEAVSDLLDAITSIISALDSGSTTTITAPLPSAALPCYSVSRIYNECGQQVSAFRYLEFPEQASCLCYEHGGNDTAATWAPSAYDGIMSSCNDFAQTQTQATITQVGNGSSAFNLCSSAGDVRATPALASASSTNAAPVSTTPAASTPIATGTSGSASRTSVFRPLVLCIGLWFCRMVM